MYNSTSICRTWVATSTALVLAIVHTLVCLLHNTTPGIDFSSSHKVDCDYILRRMTHFPLQLIDQWKQIAANLVILVATNLVSTIHTILLLLLVMFVLLIFAVLILNSGRPVHPQPDRGRPATGISRHSGLYRCEAGDGGRE